MADEVKLRRYVLPNMKGAGWAIFVIGSDGYFSVVSDYGNYAFRWTSTGCADFRQFIVSIDDDYCAGKLAQGWPHAYQGDRTRKAVEARITDLRRAGSLTKETAAEEWGLARQLDEDGLMGMARWYDATKIEDAAELAVYDLPGDVRAFCRVVLPRFQAMVRAELAAEAAPASAEART